MGISWMRYSPQSSSDWHATAAQMVIEPLLPLLGWMLSILHFPLV
jgi:hypothetical protein